MSLSADQILQADDRKIVAVQVPEWANGSGDATLYVRTMTGHDAELFGWHASRMRDEEPNDFQARLVALTACDEQGNLLFRADQVAALGRKSAACVRRVYNAAAELNGLTDTAVDDARKNSSPDPSAASSSS
jgi:hypothetical protein